MMRRLKKSTSTNDRRRMSGRGGSPALSSILANRPVPASQRSDPLHYPRHPSRDHHHDPPQVREDGAHHPSHPAERPPQRRLGVRAELPGPSADAPGGDEHLRGSRSRGAGAISAGESAVRGRRRCGQQRARPAKTKRQRSGGKGRAATRQNVDCDGDDGGALGRLERPADGAGPDFPQN